MLGSGCEEMNLTVMGESDSSVSDFTCSSAGVMLTGGISRMQWEQKGREFILPGRNREASSRECYLS